jgi:hypothetical protein
MRTIKVLAALVLTCSVPAWAQVGMITQLSGEVSVTAGGNAKAAVPFIKVNTGDKLSLAGNARLQMVYFGNGRQEIWKGGAQVEVGSLESKSTAKPEIAQLPPLVVSQLAKTPAAGQQGATGMVRVRGVSDASAVERLEKQYTDLRNSSAAGDTTPEVFFLSGLIEIKEFARAKTVLSTLGGKADYKPLVDHFTPIVNARAK